MYLEALHAGHTPHSNYDKCSARSLKDVCMNLPTHVNICVSLLPIRSMNFSSTFIWVKFGTKRANLENISSLSGWLMAICSVNHFFVFCKRSVSVCYCDDELNILWHFPTLSNVGLIILYDGCQLTPCVPDVTIVWSINLLTVLSIYHSHFLIYRERYPIARLWGWAMGRNS